MKCYITKQVWSFKELSDLLKGTDLLAEIMRNSRLVSFDTMSSFPLETFLKKVSKWADGNIVNLCAFELNSEKMRARVFFEDKADLAKFIIFFEGYDAS